MLNRRYCILRIMLFILIILFILVVVIKFKYNELSVEVHTSVGDFVNNEDSYNGELDNIIKSVNNINSKIVANNMAEQTEYKIEDSICFKYIADDKDDYIKELELLYNRPFNSTGIFNLVKDEQTNGDILYICLPNNCKIKKIESYEMVEENAQKRIIRFENSEYVMRKYDDIWKLVVPVLVCV